MPMQSVNPSSFSSGMTSDPQNNVPNPTASPDVSSGQFSVNNPSQGTSSLPSSNPITQNANSISTDILANATRAGDAAQANATQSSASSKSSGGGDIFSEILGIGSKVLPFFLNQGGAVGLAQGGMPEQNMNPQAAMSLGYLVGALHQRDYNGTPDTLAHAADQVKQRLVQNTGYTHGERPLSIQGPHAYDFNANDTDEGAESRSNRDYSTPREFHQMMSQPTHPKGFASGGDVSADSQLAQQSLMQALGLTNNSQQGSGNSNAQQQAQPATPMQQQPEPTPENQPVPTQPSQQGFMQGLAVGGPPMPPPGQPPGAPGNGPPPLQPGQTFQGDGSVKGPGGPTDDAIPAKLSNGEFVMSQPAVQFFGVDKLVKMNEQGKQGFMQAIGQVQANQQQGPGAAAPQGASMQPPMPPQAPPQQPPMGQANGGPMFNPNSTSPTMRNKTHGYMGL